MAQLDLIATSAVGLEAVVARELKALGYDSKTLQTGRILFQGDEAALCRANLWLRAADRVLLRLGAFEAKDFGQLFDQTYALPWERWLGADAAFPVNGRSVKSQLSSVPACQKIVKKAIVEKLKSVYGGAWLEESGPQYAVEVALLDDIATLTLDTSGAGLHKRGYRTLVGEAQLKETMAAALVLLSFWRPERQLVDPFCGSGTIPIEAALIGRNMAPGLNRSFAAECWPAISPDAWESARREAREQMLPDLPLRIIGTDNSGEALNLARYHAEQAGVAEQIHFQQRDFHDLTSKKEHGCVICNPPYGERLGDHDELEDLYRSMPTVLRRLKTWSHYILTAYPAFEGLVGRKADRRRKLYNARIECTYYQFYGPKPGTYLAPDAVQPREEEARGTPTAERGVEASASGGRQPPGLAAERGLPTAEHREAEASASGGRQPPGLDAESELPSTEERGKRNAEHGAEQGKQKPRVATPRPAFGGLSAKSREQGELFGRRLTSRARHLRRWPKRGITCYRLYDRDIPEVPLAVDRYEECLHIAEYERPHDRAPGEHADWLDLMARTAAKVLEVSPANVFMKRRERQRGTSQYERFAEAGHTLDVGEGGLKFRVNLSDYLDTGLFLDHRITRSMVRDAAAGKRFLNLFGYTGSFTVYAAAGEAATTTTADLSNTYLQWAQDNLHLNGLLSRRHRFVRDDALSFLKFHPPGLAYDLAVVDPPTFSNSKKTDDVWDVQHDHAELLNRLVELMAPGGVIFFSTNSRRFKLAESELKRLTIREISRQTVPEDFRNQRIHRCWRMTVGETP